MAWNRHTGQHSGELSMTSTASIASAWERRKSAHLTVLRCGADRPPDGGCTDAFPGTYKGLSLPHAGGNPLIMRRHPYRRPHGGNDLNATGYGVWQQGAWVSDFGDITLDIPSRIGDDGTVAGARMDAGRIFHVRLALFLTPAERPDHLRRQRDGPVALVGLRHVLASPTGR
jgi:hypothetical protein